MNLSTFVTRGKKALRMPPRVLLGRLRDEVRQQTKRPWAQLYPHLLRDGTLLAGSGAARLDELWDLKARDGVFFLRPADRSRWTDVFRARYPREGAAILAEAEGLLRHEFDLLGSGPVALGPSLPWHADFKTARTWPLQYSRDIEYLELDRPSDVKVPWELSRAQHFTTLGQAYWFSGDERFAREYSAEVDDWIATNPLGYGVNWACAMDVALRAVSWLWGFYFMAGADACRDAGFRSRVLRSLFTHGEFVSRNLETSDINGNHYLSDGVGLIFLGVFFRETEEGRRWLALGRRILTDEMLLQVHADGVDHEGSTPYHRLVLELFLVSYLLLERAGEPVPAACWERAARMLEFVAAYSKPDGLIPLVGDADDGRVQKLGRQALNDHRYLLSTGAVRLQRPDLKASAGRFWDESFWLLGPEGGASFDELPVQPAPAASAAFPEGGFYVMRNPVTHVFIDCGDVGMRGRGGHGHNDALSFELHMNGVNVITDCGAYVYTASREWRNRFRGTAFHNTMQVDGEEVNRFMEPDGLWQLHADAAPAGVRFALDGPGGTWQGSHLGYRRLTQPCQPHRALWLDPQRALLAVHDRVDGEGSHHVTWRWHIDPACDVTIEEGDCRIRSGGREVWMLPASATARPIRLTDGWVSPAYGVKVPTRVLVLDAEGILPVSFSYVFAATRVDDTARVAAMRALADAGAQ